MIFDRLVNDTERLLSAMESDRPIPTHIIIKRLRDFLSDRPWTCLIIPSGEDSDLDRYLCSEKFLENLVNIRPDDPGLILQLENPPENIFCLTDIFPAFRTALANLTEWPGILLWDRKRDSTFLPLPRERRSLNEASQWIFSRLAENIGFDPESFFTQYKTQFPNTVTPPNKICHFLQISDMHLGSKEAKSRLSRVQQLIRNIVDDLGDKSRIFPVVCGDTMQDPDKDKDHVPPFLDFLNNLGTEPPIVVLGNHDVRKEGIGGNNYQPAANLLSTQENPLWLDDLKIGIICFNSVAEGYIAKGFIGETQSGMLGNAMDRKAKKAKIDGYTLIGILHHHPIQVEHPDWYKKPFYEKLFGNWFEKTEKLVDSEHFLGFIRDRKFDLIMHGHKHIPRIDPTPDQITVVGCGSTVGKVSTTDDALYMSLNIITVNKHTGQLACRLMAERIVGGGLSERKSHTLNLRKKI